MLEMMLGMLRRTITVLAVDFFLNFDDKGEMKMMGGQFQCLGKQWVHHGD